MSTNPTEKSGLDETIDAVIAQMADFRSESEEFQKATDQLVKLHALKMAETSQHIIEVEKLHTIAQDSRSFRVSQDTLALVAGNLLGIIMIVGHERMHIVSSKALGFLGKLR